MSSSAAISNPTSRLADLTSTADYFARISEAVSLIELSTDAADVIELLEHATRLLGADVSVFISFIQDDQRYESMRFLVACDPAWCIEYEERGWYDSDPWLAYARRHAEPTTHIEMLSLPSQQEFLEMSRSHGFVSTALIPVPSSGGLTRIGVLCVGSRTPGFFHGSGFSAFKFAARSLAASLHEWWIKRLGKDLAEAARLSEGDLQLLRLEAEGCGTKRISDALGLSPSAIDARFHRLIVRLNVSSRKAAAHLAAEYGLI